MKRYLIRSNGLHLLVVALVMGLATAGITFSAPAAEEAEIDYPTRPITIIYPWNPGGAAEIDARTLASVLEEDLGVRVLVTNTVGGGGTAATLEVLGAPADGYTILQGWIIHMVLAPLRNPDIGYSADDFHPVAKSQISEPILIVAADSQFETLEDLVSFAQQNPGMKYDAAGAASPWALTMKEFTKQNDIEARQVPYPGAVQGMPDLLSGTLDFKVVNPTVYNQFSEEVRPLAAFTAEPIASLPDIPTVGELGYATGLEAELTPWAGYFIRSATPDPIIERLTKAIEDAMRSDAYLEQIRQANISRDFLDHDDFYDFYMNSFEQLREPVLAE